MTLLRLSPVLLLALLLLAIGSCKKFTSLEGTPPATEEPPPQVVTTGIQGRILNEQRQPVAGATVVCGGKTTSTDVNGYFLLLDLSVTDDAAVVSIEKDGYFRGYRTLMVREGQLQYIQVELLLENFNTIETSTGDVIPFLEGTLTFPASAVIALNNLPYNGTVTVRSIYVNPESATFADQMPGDLRGIDKDNKQVSLRAFSMIVFNMEDNFGVALQPDPAKPVTFRIMIPDALTTGAPQQIPLWHFNSSSGFWEQDGEATREGNDYVGTAKKAGFWLCATTRPQVILTAGLKDQNGTPIPNLRVTLLSKTDFSPTFGFSSGDGNYYGKVPSGVPLVLTVTDNCENVLHQQEIGPFTTTSKVDNINVTLPASNTLVINGVAKACDGTDVVSGHVIINVDGYNYATGIATGIFNTTVVRCTTGPVNVSFTATDTHNNRTSTMTMNVTTGTIIPTIVVCD